jgi:hypothetical protein
MMDFYERTIMTLQRYIRRLRLKPGDILLIRRDFYMSQKSEAIQNAGRLAKINFSLPFVYYDEKNDFRRMPFEELEQIYLEAKKAYGGLQDIRTQNS